MTPALALRDYQKQAIEDLWKRWDGGARRVPMVLATGLGKSVIISHSTKRFLDENPGKRVLAIAHTDELCNQLISHMRRTNPGIRVGLVKAEMNQVTAQIIVSSRQTLAHAKRRDQIRNVGMIIVDECHHATKANTYGKILDHFGAWSSDETEDGPVRSVKVMGMTATLVRGDKQKLSSVWEDCTFSRDVLFGIRRGYLLDVRGKRVIVPDLDMGRVRQAAGDFRDDSLADELERTFAPEVIAEAYREHANERRGIAFWPLVDTAYHGAKAFNEVGIPSEVIHGGLGKIERRAILQRFKDGVTQVIHNCAVLTEGFDAPYADVVVMARPTRSAGLYQQCVGRVLRPDLTKDPADRGKALILDVVGAGGRHDLRSLIDLAPERIPAGFVDDDADASLLQIEEEWLEQQEQGAGQAAEYAEDYRGETEIIEFDPLGRSQLWSRTPNGAWFMSAGTVAYAFLVESVTGDPGHYDVVLASKPQRGITPWAKATEYVDLPLDMALGWAEEVALEVGGPGTKTLTGRTAAWRKKPATECKPGFIGLGRALGVYVDGMTAGELSAAIDAKQAANTIDPLVASVRRMAASS